MEESYDQEGNVNNMEFVEWFSPRCFSAPLSILKPHPKWPNPIIEHLNRSFLVFFCDLGAAANHLRSCVEELLTQMDIPLVTKKGARIPLHHRISLFRERDAENADKAEALKWIGNIGSHGGRMTKDELFNAYDILEWLLEDVYIGHYRSLKKIVEAINQSSKSKAT